MGTTRAASSNCCSSQRAATCQHPRRPTSISVVSSAREHSAKPEVFYEMIESFYPSLPRIELFSRRQREGWAAWGNQAAEAAA